MKVTDKNYYMDGNLVKDLDFTIRRFNNNFDNVITIDGEPGTGKSTFAKQIGYYVAQKMNCGFSADTIFFDLDNLNKYAVANKGKVIIYDEAAIEAMGIDWSNEHQKQFVKILYVARKNRNFFIIVNQEIRKLQSVIVYRSLFLLRVYAKAGIERGYYDFYDIDSIKYLYDAERKGIFGKIRRDLYGRFANPANYPELINEAQYEKNKDRTIMLLAESTQKKNVYKDHASVLVKELVDTHKITQRELSRRTGIPQPTISILYKKEA